MRTSIILTLLIFAGQYGFAQSYTEYYETGKKHIADKEYKPAAEAFAKASDKAKSKTEKLLALMSWGEAQSIMNKHEEAAEIFGKALAIEPSSPALLLQRGNSLLQIDSVEAAVKCYDKILDSHPDNRDARFFRA